MRLFHSIAGLQTYLSRVRQGKRVGLVPTMGALHPGHLSLIQQAKLANEVVVVSIFVNPLQFAPQEDLDQYPRTLDSDRQQCEAIGVDVIFAPTPEALGIQGQESAQTLVIPPDELTQNLCGKFRPGHFAGVATIVTKLFNIVQPETAYFGEKDAQQLAIIRRLVADLNFPIEIKACPTQREESGLALSSRNQYLSDPEKELALVLSRSLQVAQKAFIQGEKQAEGLINQVQQQLALTPEVRVQYIELVHPQTLTPLTEVTETGLLAIAAYVGSTRLIDNILLRNRKPIIAIDGPAGAGKSTVTRLVAKELNLLYLDTGAMYRALAWLVRQSDLPLTDEAGIAELVSQASLELVSQAYPQPTLVKINGQDVTEAIRTPEVTSLVSAIAAQKTVRAVLLKAQQSYGKTGGLVAEGRDIGTAVFPDAELKIFLTASVQERARRRLADFQAQGQTQIRLEDLEKEIASRDQQDSTRAIAPLKKAIDAIEIITDGLSITEVTHQIIQLYMRFQSNLRR
ncbi:MAG: bifunctional pantoate--beta-alanine ligase/(d)CMP kinase [Snowella sp.]|nr:bifunctional pantoate--beta-alanine ligase/(d)CMP kinase [Snowella sp.]